MPEPEIPSANPGVTPPVPNTQGLQPHVAAGLACLFPIVGSIIFLVIEKRNKFVRFWAMQSLLLGLLVFAIGILFYVAGVVLGHLWLIGTLMVFFLWLLHWPFRIGWVVVYLVCIVKAFSHQEWEIPWLGKIAREQLAKLDRTDLPAS